MSRLGEYENEIVERLTEALIGGEPAFAVVQGATGGWRPALREALLRERQPAAYVSFIDEATAPEVRAAVRGPRFVVLIAASSLRIATSPRLGDAHTHGALALIDAARAALDYVEIEAGFQLVAVHTRFVEGDDRSIVYELMYRVWPVVAEEPRAALRFDDVEIAGAHSRLAMEVGPHSADSLDIEIAANGCIHRKTMDVPCQMVFWRGAVRAESPSALNDLEAAFEALIDGGDSGTIDEVGGRSLSNCTFVMYVRKGPRREEGGYVVQDAELVFQKKP